MDKQEKITEIKQSVADTYNAVAKDFDLTRYKPWPDTKNFVEKLEPNSAVLEMGCGNGRDTLYMASQGHRIVAIDISEKLLNIAYQKALANGYKAKIHANPLEQHVTDHHGIDWGIASIHFLCADICQLPLKDEISSPKSSSILFERLYLPGRVIVSFNSTNL